MRKLIGLALLCMSGMAIAQQEIASAPASAAPLAVVAPEPVEKTVPIEIIEKKSAHKFFDSTNISLTAASILAGAADGITTQHVLNRRFALQNGTVVPVHYVEANPIARPLVNQGWPGQIAATGLMVGADLTVQAWLHRREHHRLERIVPVLFTAGSAFAALHNSHNY